MLKELPEKLKFWRKWGIQMSYNFMKYYYNYNFDKIIETESELYLVMEYCACGELFDYIVAH